MLSIGIVGLPNVGKSTLFKALTKKQVDISNYPFTTINPNVGVVAVPDKRLELLAKNFNSKKIIPAAIEFVDIAGLVKGAAEGEGLGNQFLARIREVDAIAQVVRIFEDEQIGHVHKKIDPLNDIEIIETELSLADLQSKEKRAEKKPLNRFDESFNPELRTEGLTASKLGTRDKNLSPLELLTDKKIVYVFNSSEEQIKNKWQPSVELMKKIGNNRFVVFSCKFELMLSETDPEDSALYLSELGIEKPGLYDLIQESYRLLDLITFFTTGEDETRAWTTEINTLIPHAVRTIHTDFEKYFIKAEVINWKELLDIGSWTKARELGKLKLAGKDYIVQEGDVIEIKI